MVVGGGGAVGLSAVQFAVAAGCSVVTTCGSQSVDRLLAAGAEQAVDYIAEVVWNLLCVTFPVNCSNISIMTNIAIEVFQTTMHNILVSLW